MAGKNALDVLKRILLSFRRNWGLKLISLFFAAILWNYVVVEIDPVRPVVISGVPVTPAGMQALKNAGLTVSGDIADYFKQPVTVQMELKRSAVAAYSKDNIPVTADLSNITREGPVEVTLTSGIPVTSITPPKLTVKIEKLTQRKVPVTIEYINKPPQGYEIGTVEIKPSELEISGANADVMNVAKAVIKVDVGSLTSLYSQATEVELQDKNKQPVPNAGLEFTPSPSCIVTLQILKTKTVKIADPMNHLSGEVAKGYQVDRVDIDQPEIEISGPANLVDPIDTLTYDAINIEGLTKTTSFSKPLKLPQGVHAVSTNAVAVSVKVSQIMTTVTFTDMKIKIVDLEPGLKVDETFTATVTLTCPELNAKKIKRANVNLYADAAGFAEGTHPLTVMATYTDPDAGVTDDIKISRADILAKLVSNAAP